MALTREQLLQILRDNAEDKNDDFESAHAIADNALLAYINDPEISEAFKEVGRYYA